MECCVCFVAILNVVKMSIWIFDGGGVGSDDNGG